MTPNTEFTHDVFISYRRVEPDLSWVREHLLPALKACGLKPFIDEVDFILGEPLVKELERGVTCCRYTLAVMTPAYQQSAWVEMESLMAQHLGIEQSTRRLIAVMREPCDPPLRIRFSLWLDMTNDSQFDAQIARLCTSLKT
ncbi:MAG: toll/interleukin-1 receptor domain-containing protein [Anaerolineae bacterium]